MRGGVPRRPGANGQLKPTSRERASPSREPLNEHRHGRDNENRNECVRPNLFARNPKIDVEHMTKNRRDQHRGEHDRQKTPQSKSSWVPHRTVPPEAHPRLVFAKTSDRSRAFACCGTTSQIFAMKAPHLGTVAREGAQPSAVDSVWNKKGLHGKDSCPPPQRFRNEWDRLTTAARAWHAERDANIEVMALRAEDVDARHQRLRQPPPSLRRSRGLAGRRHQTPRNDVCVLIHLFKELEVRAVILAARYARAMHDACPSQGKEGAGNAGCWPQPMARLQKSKQAAVTPGSAKSSGIPCAMVLTLIRALPGARALLPPSSR
jgi:hypothetical protein